jgi:ABC-type branched-subunit amino acid transport system ATPase component
LHSSTSSLLYVDNLITGYGKKPILHGITMAVNLGEIVSIVGHNGAGKSTLLKAIFGLLPFWEGQMFLDGELLTSFNPRKLRRLGVVYVPQGSRVFGDLTVSENLEMGSISFSRKAQSKGKIEHVLAIFPDLKPRLHHKGKNLSGGQKQMLALATALLLSPRLLLLDEPSLGLAPPIINQSFSRIQEISKAFDVSILIIGT